MSQTGESTGLHKGHCAGHVTGHHLECGHVHNACHHSDLHHKEQGCGRLGAADIKEFEVSMARFFRGLREAGLRLTIAEAIQAMEALAHIDVGNRDEFKAALKVMLVKDPSQVAAFEHVFYHFFATPRVKKHLKERVEVGREAERAALQKAEEELIFQDAPLELPAEDKLLYGNLNDDDRQRIREFLEKSSKGKKVEMSFKPIIEKLVRGQLEAWRRQMLEPIEFQLPPSGDEDLDDILQDFLNQEPQAVLMREDLKKIAEKDLPRVTQLIKELSRRLAADISRRYRLSRQAVSVDVRRSIRRNIRFGGVMMRLSYKKKRSDRPRLVLLCDVSGSMARYATFVMQFIYGLSSSVSTIESFIFSEDLERVTPCFRCGGRFENVMAKVISQSQTWGKGTQMNVALESLFARHASLFGHKTLLIILSDGKTLHPEKVGQNLERIGRRVKDIIWLNTLPKREWPKAGIMASFQKKTRMYECYTIDHLQRILNRHL